LRTQTRTLACPNVNSLLIKSNTSPGVARSCWIPLILVAISIATPALADTRLSDYIRPLVGTKGEGNTFPGPSAPFGMIQLSPDTDKTNWLTASGYEYTDPTILGFSLTHLSGTGIPDLGDFLFMPQIGKPEIVSGLKETPDQGYQSRYSHNDEVASAGYYKVKLQKSGVTVELTASQRAGILRFTFPESDEASIMTDLSHVLSGARWRVVQSRVRVEDTQTITGFHLVNGWAKERYLYFAARYSRPFDEAVIYKNGAPEVYDSYKHYRFRSRNEAAATNIQFFAKYKTRANEVIQVKVAVSSVSTENALKNLDAELPHWDFEKVREATRRSWDRELSRIQIEGSQLQKEMFYTSLYHCYLTPNVHEDLNGEYRGWDQNIHTAGTFTKYTIFSLWDTYRAEHPLLALIDADRNADMINSMLAHYDQSADNLLPMWELQGNETWCMIGYHAVPVIADAVVKGLKGFDHERAYAAAKATAMNPDYDGLEPYRQLGYVPFDLENESLSKTLEYAYDDYCIARMARALGKKDDYAYFMKRAASYKNIFDPSIGWMRPKDSKGNWRTPFQAANYGPDMNHDVTEGTSSQYSWYVPHDVPGLIELFGGNDRFAEKLDALFTSTEGLKQLSENDQRGCIGDYWHGNEPSHHIIYLYNYVGQPWKAAERLRQVVTTQYGSDPGSLSGNDDCGQMSAWLLFTSMGFYPVAPGSDFYAIGAPQIPKAVMRLSNGRKFTMTAEGLSDQNIHVQSVTLNGRKWDSAFLPYRELKRGGSLHFTMGPKPGATWGTKVPELP
jgi:predicted alpha-1,2-mannosidase